MYNVQNCNSYTIPEIIHFKCAYLQDVGKLKDCKEMFYLEAQSQKKLTDQQE
jgi:hypothetical protein